MARKEVPGGHNSSQEKKVHKIPAHKGEFRSTLEAVSQMKKGKLASLILERYQHHVHQGDAMARLIGLPLFGKVLLKDVIMPIDPLMIKRIYVNADKRWERTPYEGLNDTTSREKAPNVLTIPSGPEWKRQHGQMKEAFQTAQVAKHIPEFNDHITQMFADIKTIQQDPETQEQGVDLLKTHIIDRLMFSFINTVVAKNLPISEEDQLIIQEGIRAAYFWNRKRDLAKTLEDAKKKNPKLYENYAKNVYEGIHPIVEGFVKQYEENDEIQDSEDVLARLLQGVELGNLSMGEVHANITTLMVAGHETATSVFGSALHVAGQPENKHILERLKAENERVCGDRMPGLEELNNMPELEAFMNEVMRLYVPNTFTIRQDATGGVVDAIYDDEGNMVAPAYYSHKGAILFIPQEAAHRHPRYFPNPDQFDMDRFLKKDKKGNLIALNPEQIPGYHPFGMGRFCLGRDMARLELKLVFARMLQEFDIEATTSPEEVKKVYEMVMHLDNVRTKFIPKQEAAA